MGLTWNIGNQNQGFPEKPQIIDVEVKGEGEPSEVAAMALRLLDAAREAGWKP
jgi:hypothetical protein